MEQYAASMGRSASVCDGADLERLLQDGSIDLVLGWRDDEALLTLCNRYGVQILALAQNCAALAE